jgi:glycolate oxidase FAD binding subunit
VNLLEEDTCSLDDAGPFAVVRPATAAEVGDLVRAAAADGHALFPLGGRTMLGLGLPPSRPGVGADLRGLDHVVDYPARDMTITVGAGIALARLQALLRGEGQRLPVDVPRPERATLGGALATNTSGPRRYGFGTLRDYVIGMSTVNDEGHEVKAGGRVVKNVAGYDLPKLHVGALGTLGIISQVTLKLRPLPEETALVTFRCGGDHLADVLDRLHRSRTRPVCLDVLNAAAARELPAPDHGGGAGGGWLVVAGFEESYDAMRWQMGRVIRELPAERVCGLDAVANAAAEPLWRALTEFRLRDDAVLTFKANLLPHAVANFCRLADGLAPTLIHAHAGSGIVVGHVAGELTEQRAAGLLQKLREAALSAQGNVVVLHCPAAWKAALPVWGAPRGDLALMRAVKEKLDPRHLFNPGRFLNP